MPLRAFYAVYGACVIGWLIFAAPVERHFNYRFDGLDLGLACGFLSVSHGQGRFRRLAGVISTWGDPPPVAQSHHRLVQEVGCKKRR